MLGQNGTVLNKKLYQTKVTLTEHSIRSVVELNYQNISILDHSITFFVNS